MGVTGGFGTVAFATRARDDRVDAAAVLATLVRGRCLSMPGTWQHPCTSIPKSLSTYVLYHSL